MTAFLVTLITSQADAKRTKVRIHKPSPPIAVTLPETVPLWAVPAALIGFDLARRISCDPRIAVSTGSGDPGFDPNGPKTGNFLVPAIYRKECGGARPKWYGW